MLILQLQAAAVVGEVQLHPQIELLLCIGLVELRFIGHGVVPACAVVRFKHELVGQLVKIDIVELVPDSQQRDQIILADFLPDPVADLVLIH